MEKVQLTPGKKYRGSFWINDYGEFQCRPDGKAPEDSGRMKTVNETGGVKIQESKYMGRAIISFSKKNRDWGEMMQCINIMMELVYKYFFKK